ncbi:hypothetical protein BDF20DRAFT_865351 [Mycotypha africana]|uniref:uncharacterized protein n=1 Tax=Mycotypha africana TaxID=64632 RepID=UPI002301515E|nr:uncharacterized protein BDF20DRAFT_865351 [Mycotypha africana]KAI8982173.1 hypothetical protein BDF20DRAFT_865351 [Mycotypha africana]
MSQPSLKSATMTPTSPSSDVTTEDADHVVIPAKTLLTGAAGTFGAGILGAIAYTKRKQSRHWKQDSAVTTTTKTHHPLSPGTAATTPSTQLPPKMTAAEYAVAKKEASLFAFKTLGYGTLLAFTGAGLLAYTVSWWLDVHSFKEFSSKLQTIVPQKTSKLRRMLGGKRFEMTVEEEKELEKLNVED